jgi:hypothetical protein
MAAPQMDEGIAQVITADILTPANFYLWGHLKMQSAA